MRNDLLIDDIQIIELVEYEERLLPKVSGEIAAAINQTGFISVTPTFGEDALFKADSKIGVIRVGNLQISVMPKFPVRNLFYLLGLHEGIKFDEKDIGVAENSNVTDLIFQSFLSSAQASTSRGLLTGYRYIQETSKVLRGRILLSDQVSKRFGRAYPVEISYDDFTENIPENIELKMAISNALRFGNLSESNHREYRHLSRTFSEIDDSINDLTWNLNRQNTHYWNSLILAELINQSQGFFEKLGGITVHGFTVDMYRVFEKFLLRELKLRLEKNGGVVETKTLHLDVENRQKAQIDIMWRKDGEIKFIADAKYKDPDSNWESALYQVNAYATAFSLNQIHLIYALPVDDEPLVLKGSGTLIYRHGINLDASIREIGKEIDSLCEVFVS
jgi:5-methylcytosine-specific restriction enzyme subunit McrC